MAQLIRHGEAQNKWMPVSVNKLEALLGKVIKAGAGYKNSTALRKNIAYNMQYIEFLNQTVVEYKLTGVLVTQTWKNFVITGCGIVESLMYYMLVVNNSHTTTDWEIAETFISNPKKIGNKEYKIETSFYKKLNIPIATIMKFEAIIKKAENNKILNLSHETYRTIKYLKDLRNKVHLHHSQDDYDTDWNSFFWNDACKMAKVLYQIFTNKAFSPTIEEINYFKYLLRYKETNN